MSSEPPGRGAIPGWGQQPPDGPESPPAAPAGPPPAVPQAPPPPAAGATSGWGAPAATGPGAPEGTPPGTWNPQPARPADSSGCLKVLLVLIVIAVVGFGLLVAGLAFIGSRIVDSVDVNPDGSVGTACPFISDSDLGEALGSEAQALVLDGLWDATLGIILDKRVLPDAEDCWITADESTPTGRIAVFTGADASARFARARQDAAPTSEDQGGGVSIEDSGYFAGDVAGLGDEAFCTGVSPAIQAGVLARRGNTLVYVSLNGPADALPGFGTTDDGVITAPEICATAQEVARRILP